MPKVTLNPITAGYASVDALNANFDAIEAAIEQCVFRDGTAPNSLTADLDANSQRIINLPEGTANTEPVTVEQLNKAVFNTDLTFLGVDTLEASTAISSLNGISAVNDIVSENGPVGVNSTGTGTVATLGRDANGATITLSVVGGIPSLTGQWEAGPVFKLGGLGFSPSGNLLVGSTADDGVNALQVVGGIAVKDPSLIGYSTGAGGDESQATLITDTVTINKPCGRVTTVFTGGFAAHETRSFLVSNSFVTNASTVIVNFVDIGGVVDKEMIVTATIASSGGGFIVKMTNTRTTSEASTIYSINFAVINSSIS